MAGKSKFQNTSYVDPTGRIARVVTSQEEAEFLEADGWSEGELPDREELEARRAAAREALNSGREGNLAAAESSTTKVAKDGVSRPATSGS